MSERKVDHPRPRWLWAVPHCASLRHRHTAPMALSRSQPQVIAQESKELKEPIVRLNERMEETFVTVNNVTRGKGIKQAQNEY